MKKIYLFVFAIFLLISCGEKKEKLTLSGLKKSEFIVEKEGKPIALYVLTNEKGAEVCITNYGGRLVSLMVPDRNGKMVDVVLGYDNAVDYLASTGNFGALIGRFGNRIANAKFTLDGVEYTLPQNNGAACLHGGPEGFEVQVWVAKQLDEQTLELTYLSKDDEAGFPGNLLVKVTYKLTDDNAVDITYEATTDKPTVVNLTNHSYFNLSGVRTGLDILDNQILIDADSYTFVDKSLIPTGELALVENTPMDLRISKEISLDINNPFEQLVFGGGYDHNYVLNAKGDIGVLAAKIYSPLTGIAMEVYTNEPAIQIYTGNVMSGSDVGKHGVKYPVHGALCLETQHYPDSPNQPTFPTTTLLPCEKYYSRCIYKFIVE